MNQPIHPFDIYRHPVYEAIENISDSTAKLKADEMAAIANLLIKYGLVSPPVYVLRNTDNGKLLQEIVIGEVFMTANSDKAEIQGAVYEHWKGQMQ